VSDAAEAFEVRPARTSPLRAADFRRLLIGDSVARLGYQVAQFMLPLLAVTTLHASPFQVGLVSVSQAGPVIVLSLVAGLVADRVSARNLIMLCNLIRAAGIGLLGLLYGLDGLAFSPLLLTGAVIGSAAVFYDVGYQSTVPKVLEGDRLIRGNGYLQASFNATLTSGPALAGLLVEDAGVAGTLGVVGGLFVAALLAYRSLQAGAAVRGPQARPSLVRGLKFTWHCRPIRDLCVQSGLFNLFEQAFETAFLLYAVRTAGLSGGEIGLVVGAGGVGAVAGSLTIGHFSRRLHAGWSAITGQVSCGVILLAAALLAQPLKSQAGAVFAIAFCLNGAALSLYNVFVASIRQALSPREFMGAVTAAYRLVSFGPIPLGGLLGGVLVELVGAPYALTAVAGGLLLSSLHLLPSPVKQLRSVEDAGSVAGSIPPETVSDEEGATAAQGAGAARDRG
jgi:MFS family permease